MNSHLNKSEYGSDEAVAELLRRESKAINPPEDLLRSLLASLPAKPISSPYARRIKGFSLILKRVSLVAVTAAILFIGGAAYIHYRTSSSEGFAAKDNAIDVQIAAIDAQLNGLDVDNSQVDHILNYSTSS